MIRRHLGALLGACSLLCAQPVFAQDYIAVIDGNKVPQKLGAIEIGGIFYPLNMLVDSGGVDASDPTNHAIRVNVVAGGSGGGVVTAASGGYASGALALGAIVDLGTGSSPGANTTNGYLKALNTAVGSPFQAGGSIGNTTFAVTNTGTFAVQPSDAVAQGSTTSGQSGALVQCAAATAAPSYTTAKTNPLSCDLAGDLRVNVVAGGAGGGAVYGPTANGSAAANPPTLIGGTANGTATGSVGNWKVDSSGLGYINCSNCTGGSPTGAIVSDTPTIQNASYVSGNCMGGFQTIALGSTQSVLSSLTLASKGGLVTAKQIYLFSASPSSSTCTDKSTFTIASADVSKVIETISVNPSVTTGTTSTYGTASGLSLGIPSGGTIYVAIVETTTETPASTTDLVVNFSAF